jgi:hypothetical protein
MPQARVGASEAGIPRRYQFLLLAACPASVAC